MQAWSLCLPGAQWVPQSPFYKLSPASHAITSAGNFLTGSFPYDPEKDTAAGGHSFYPLFGGAFTLQICTLEFGSKAEQHTLQWERDWKKSTALQTSNFRSKVVGSSVLMTFSYSAVTSVLHSRAALCFHMKHTTPRLQNSSHFHLTPWGGKQYNSLYFSLFHWTVNHLWGLRSPHQHYECLGESPTLHQDQQSMKTYGR